MATKRSTPKPRVAAVEPMRDIANPDDYGAALAEAGTLADLLLGFDASDNEAEQVAALRKRGWPLFHIDGETALPAGVAELHPRLIREYWRLYSLVRDVITPETLAAYQARRSIAKARRGAEFIRHRLDRIDALLAQPDGITAPELKQALGEIEAVALPWLAATEFAARWIAGTQQEQ